DRLVGGRVADLLEEVEVAVRVAGLALRGVAEQAGDVGVTLDVGLLGEVEVATVRLRFTGERFLQVGVRLGALELRHLELLPLRGLVIVRAGWSYHGPGFR